MHFDINMDIVWQTVRADLPEFNFGLAEWHLGVSHNKLDYVSHRGKVMAIEKSIIDYGKGLNISVTGILRGSQIIDFLRNQVPEDLIKSLKYKIVDKSGVRENYISVEEIKAITELDKYHLTYNPIFLTVIIVQNEIIKQTSNVWSAYMRPNNDRVGVFNNYIDAMNWISQKLVSDT